VQRVGERAAFPEQCAEGAGVGLDDRMRILGRAAAASVVMPVTAALGSVTGQAIASRAGLHSITVVGMVLTGLGCVLLTQVSVDGSYLGDIFLGLLVFGPGLGAAYVAASIGSLAEVAEGEAGLAFATAIIFAVLGLLAAIALLGKLSAPGHAPTAEPTAARAD
jgi:hypothetical protein